MSYWQLNAWTHDLTHSFILSCVIHLAVAGLFLLGSLYEVPAAEPVYAKVVFLDSMPLVFGQGGSGSKKKGSKGTLKKQQPTRSSQKASKKTSPKNTQKHVASSAKMPPQSATPSGRSAAVVANNSKAVPVAPTGFKNGTKTDLSVNRVPVQPQLLAKNEKKQHVENSCEKITSNQGIIVVEQKKQESTAIIVKQEETPFFKEDILSPTDEDQDSLDEDGNEVDEHIVFAPGDGYAVHISEIDRALLRQQLRDVLATVPHVPKETRVVVHVRIDHKGVTQSVVMVERSRVLLFDTKVKAALLKMQWPKPFWGKDFKSIIS